MALAPKSSVFEFSGKNPINPPSFDVSSRELCRIKTSGNSRKRSRIRELPMALVTVAYILTGNQHAGQGETPQ
jgi:hypothetical protein